MCSERVRTIRLYGILGARFGRLHRLAVTSAGEAIHALCVLLPGFDRFLMESKDKGLTYAVFIGKENVGPERLAAPTGSNEIRIAPLLIGSKRAGLVQTIVGAAIFAASFVVPVMQGWGQSLGFSLLVGGALQMLSPQGKGLASQDSPQHRASYSFNGPVNTSAQGNPVGLLYGQAVVGSAVISAGIYAQDQL